MLETLVAGPLALYWQLNTFKLNYTRNDIEQVFTILFRTNSLTEEYLGLQYNIKI